MPLAATVPNNASPAPPSTGSGIAAMIAPSFGKSPSTSRIPPLTATTKRLLMPVSATSPTFCANALTGNPFNRPPETAVDRVSARSPFDHGLAVGRATDHHADGEQVGRGLGHDHQHHDDHRHDRGDLECRRAEMERSGDREAWRLRPGVKSTLPKIAATTPPATRPIRMAMREKKPGRNR